VVVGSDRRQGFTAAAPLRNPPLSAGRAPAQTIVDLVAQLPRPRRYPRQERRRFGDHCRNLTCLHHRGQIVQGPAGAPTTRKTESSAAPRKVAQQRSTQRCSQ